MIVSVTRDDLRDEFTMADEAFALSPISARAAQPREEDYNAISEAFMETSRGRWFLGEYAKRNRNADTRMVLDAVARIEETIAAQKAPPPDDNRLTEALAAIKASLVEARTTATNALGDLGLEENLAPARKGARVIREIAWRLREIGADGRICDLIDSQVSAIESACGKTVTTDAMPALSAAFDLIEERIRAFDDSEADAPQPMEKAVAPAPETAGQTAAEQAAPAVASAAEEAIPSPAAAAQTETVASTDETAPAATIANDAETAMSSPAMAAEPVVPMAEAPEAKAETAEVLAEIADPSPEAAGISAEAADAQDTEIQDTEIQDTEIQNAEIQDADTEDADTEAADAHDDAVLDMVAMEMAAPDPDDIYDPPESEVDEIQSSYETAVSSEPQVSYESQAVASPPAAPLSVVAERPEPATAAIQPAPEPEPSLGSSLIASGLVRGRAVSRPDPFAAIRRMSQAEKIALFS
jgi:hypothetical protein